jgi:hypothetical protein
MPGRRFIELALKTNAVIVSPDYRLFPESTPSDILEDIGHFWEWLYREYRDTGSLGGPGIPGPDVDIGFCEQDQFSTSSPRLDLNRIAVNGESSGENKEIISFLFLSFSLCDLSMNAVRTDQDPFCLAKVV